MFGVVMIKSPFGGNTRAHSRTKSNGRSKCSMPSTLTITSTAAAAIGSGALKSARPTLVCPPIRVPAIPAALPCEYSSRRCRAWHQPARLCPVITDLLPFRSVFNRRSHEQAPQDVFLNEPSTADVFQVVAGNTESFLAAIENVIGQDAAVGLPQQAFRLAAVVTQIFVKVE